MKNTIVLSVLLLLFIRVHGQQTTDKLHYKKVTKSAKVYQTLTSNDSLTIEKTGRSKKGTITRKITISEKNYTYFYYKHRKKAEIRTDDDDRILGSYQITGKNKYDITLRNGTIYDWKKGKSGKEWKYLVNGTEVMNCKILKEEGKKYLQYNILNPDAPDLPNALLVSKIFGVDFIQAKASAPAVYGGVIAGTIAITLLSTQQDTTPKVE